MSQQNPTFYSKVVVHPNGVGGTSFTAIVSWVAQFEDVLPSDGLCVLTANEGPNFLPGLYAQIPNPAAFGALTWKRGLNYSDICTMIADGSVIDIYLNVTADQTFSAGYKVWRNGNLTSDSSLHADTTSVWVVTHIPGGGTGTGTVSSVNNQLPDGGGNVVLASSNLSDAASLLRTAQLAVANGIATLDSSGKLSSAQAPTATVSSVAGRNGAVVLTSADLTDVATIVKTTSLAVANGIATLDGTGHIPTGQLPSSILGAMNYQGGWNASSNSPTLSSGVGTKGFYYTVSVAGSTTLDGVSSWSVGDHVSYNGTVWEKFDGIASEVISVAGRTGVITLSTSDLTDFASAVSTPLSQKVNSSLLGVANGVATLDGSGKLSAAQAPTASVTSVAGRTGAVTIASTDLTDVATAITTPLSLRVLTSAVGAASGVASLDSGGKVPTSQLPASILGAQNYQGAWNATTNSPTLTSSTGTKGFYYTVSVAGSTTLDGISQWNAGDHVSYNGTVWEKFDGLASEVISVAGRTGVVVLTTADLTDYSATIGTPLSTATSNITTLQGQANPITGTLASNDTWRGFGAISGINAGTTVGLWAPVYMSSAGTWLVGDATSVSSAPVRGLAASTGTSGNPLTVLDEAVIRHDSWTWTKGGDIFLAVGGGLTQTRPSGTTGYVVQCLGYALSATTIRINIGSYEYTTLA